TARLAGRPGRTVGASLERQTPAGVKRGLKDKSCSVDRGLCLFSVSPCIPQQQLPGGTVQHAAQSTQTTVETAFPKPCSSSISGLEHTRTRQPTMAEICRY